MSGLSECHGQSAGDAPQVAQRARDGRPLPLLLRERRAPVVGDRVVATLASLGGRPPFGGDVAEPLQTVEQRIEHPVGPLELAAGQLTDALEDGVAIALALAQ